MSGGEIAALAVIAAGAIAGLAWLANDARNVMAEAFGDHPHLPEEARAAVAEGSGGVERQQRPSNTQTQSGLQNDRPEAM